MNTDPSSANGQAGKTSPEPDWPYAVGRGPLRKWARERVQLHRENGHVIASFRYDGSTCRFTGHPLTAVLSMKLIPADGDDFVIEDTRSLEGEGDTGCSRMCSYVASPETFMDDIDAENPLRGMCLSQAILWNPQMEMAGCLCSRESRNHKWRNAVQAIHLALNAKN